VLTEAQCVAIYFSLCLASWAQALVVSTTAVKEGVADGAIGALSCCVSVQFETQQVSKSAQTQQYQ
jgi:hypothetical protein